MNINMISLLVYKNEIRFGWRKAGALVYSETVEANACNWNFI